MSVRQPKVAGFFNFRRRMYKAILLVRFRLPDSILPYAPEPDSSHAGNEERQVLL